MKKKRFEITGMTCQSCAIQIEELLKSKGVLGIDINFLADRLECEVDTENSANDIVEIIESSNSFHAAQSDSDFDLIIIGGGSSAFSGAITAENLGLKVMMVNGGLDFGGTCVNVGCVPSKHLIRAGEAAYYAGHSNFSGIKPKGADIDFTQIIRATKDLVSTLQQKKYMDVVKDFEKLTLIEGWAEFENENTISVNGQTFRADKFLIATGATTNIPEISGLDKIEYLTNASLFEQEEHPKSLTILGAGYIGLEIASAYNRLGKHPNS